MSNRFMKNLLLCVLLFAAIPSYAAVESDLVAGIDPSGYSVIGPTQLLQLISNGTIGQTNKGGVIRCATTPNTVSNPRYTNFLWLDTSLGFPAILKQWSGSAWVTATIGAQGVSSTNIANGAVGTAQLGTNAVTTVNIADNAVTTAKIGALQVNSDQIADGAISNRHLAATTITGAKLAYNTILGTNISDSTITGSKIAPATIAGANIGSYTITNDKLATNTVGRSNIIAGAVGSEAITNNAVQTNNMSITGGGALMVMQVDQGASFAGWAMPVIRSNVVLNVISNFAAGTTTIAHGLGVRPTLLRLTLTNAIIDQAWNPGDEIEWSIHDDGASGVNLASDATNIYLVLSGTALGGFFNKTTGARVATPTIGRWGFRAYVFR